MSNMTEPDDLRPIVRTSQIIIAAMIMGVLAFVAVTLFVTQFANPARIVPVEGPANYSLPLITCLAVALGLMELVLSFVMPSFNVARARRQMALEGKTATTKGNPSEARQLYPASYTGKLAQLYQTQLIIGGALLEGGAFFAAIAYMLERSPIALVTVVVLLGTLAARFPTSDRVNAWLDRQLGLLQEERQSGAV